MTPSQIRNENYMELIDGQGTLVAAIELYEARTPRVGECIRLLDGVDPAGVTYQVDRVVYCYGKRSGTVSLLKVTVGVR